VLIDAVNSGDRILIKKGDDKILKYEGLATEI
jgi:hypothetical protein